MTGRDLAAATNVRRHPFNVAHVAMRAVAALACLLLSTQVTAQLPPDVEADRQIRKAEREIERGQHEEAAATLERVSALSAAGVELPPAYWLARAKAMTRVGSIGKAERFEMAEDSIARFLELTGGREGDRYDEAIQLLDQLDRAKAAACELELPPAIRNRINERVGISPWTLHEWEPNHDPDWVARGTSWSGYSCKDSSFVAQGFGEIVVKIEYKSVPSESWVLTLKGRIVDGHAEGAWHESLDASRWSRSRGSRSTTVSTYRAGVRHGEYTGRTFSGGTHEGTLTGSFIDGLQEGAWTYIIDERRWSGLYRGGRREGEWLVKHDDGRIWQHFFREGKRHGTSTLRSADGETIAVYRWIDGQEHGLATDSRRHSAAQALYVRGKSVAALYQDGSCRLGAYDDPDRIGHARCRRATRRQIMKMFELGPDHPSLLE